MFTLKIRWTLYEPGPNGSDNSSVAEEHVMFLPAKTVTQQFSVTTYDGKLTKPPTMQTWDDDSFLNYLDCTRGKDGRTEARHPGRMIEVVDEAGKYAWYLCSAAWLLGPTGSTIERIAP